MSKKPYRINNKDLVVKAENAVYDGNIENVDNAQDAIDNLDGRVAELEESGGGSSVVVDGAVATTLPDPNPFNLQRVFTKENLEASTGWQFMMKNFTASPFVSQAQGAAYTMFIEVQCGDESLGANGVTNVWSSIFGLIVNNPTLNHVYDGKKDIYSFSKTVSNISYDGGMNFKLAASAIGKTVKLSAYAVINGSRYYCKSCWFSATATVVDPILPYRLEWEDAATTPDKVDALILNHQWPMISSGSEYDPFLSVNTTPRVIVTLVSDDADLPDYNSLRPCLKEIADEAGVDIRWTIAVPSNLINYSESGRGSRMSASMIRDLVANYGVSIMSHGYNHVVLNTNGLTDAEREKEVVNSKIQLERKLGVPCTHYCLPGGGYTESTWGIVAKRYLSAAKIEDRNATGMGHVNTPDTNRFQIRRVSCDIRTGETEETAGTMQIGVIQAAAAWVQTNQKSAWIVFYTHGHEWNTGYHHEWTIPAIANYCVENGIPMLNYSEAYAEIYPPINRLKSLLGIS